MTAARAAIVRYTEAAFALAVTGAALIWPPAALLIGAAFLVALAVVADRRAPTE